MTTDVQLGSELLKQYLFLLFVIGNRENGNYRIGPMVLLGLSMAIFLAFVDTNDRPQQRS
jgi:hypothetical protein